MKAKRVNIYKVGVYFWGVMGFAVGILGLLFVTKQYVLPDGLENVMATLIATSGVAWSWFIQLEQKERHHIDLIGKTKDKPETPTDGAV